MKCVQIMRRTRNEYSKSLRDEIARVYLTGDNTYEELASQYCVLQQRHLKKRMSKAEMTTLLMGLMKNDYGFSKLIGATKTPSSRW